jgi:esterase/lipase superfamily enzyme
MVRRYEYWDSPALGRRMELLWFGDRGLPVVMFPTSMGRFFQYEDTKLIEALRAEVDAGVVQCICVDSVDEESWYSDAAPPDRVRRHDQYDRYVRDELVPLVRERTQRDRIASFGCSFGGYHAANLAGRYPETIVKAVCFSAIYDVTRFLDGYWDDSCYFHSPAAYIANMDEGWIRRLAGVEWVIATGEFDSLVDDNRRFSSLLASKGVPHHTEIWPGVFGHDWPFWNANVSRLLCKPTVQRVGR